MNEKCNKNAKLEQLTKMFLGHEEEKGLIVKDPYFGWLRTTAEGSVHEIRIWSILLIKSVWKWCINLSGNLFLYCNGVSKSENIWRRTTIHELRYNLLFNVSYLAVNFDFLFSYRQSIFVHCVKWVIGCQLSSSLQKV